jgi:glycosyltransferase involved in cell wall biosynthesis
MKVDLLTRMLTRRPRICILADFPGWAYDISARQLKRQLAPEFKIAIRYVIKRPHLAPKDYDLLHVCFWGENYHRPFGFDRERVIKEVSSHRWESDPRYGPCTPEEFAKWYLADCDTVICTSLRLARTVGQVFPRTFHTPNGFDSSLFRPTQKLSGTRLVFGWAGNVADPVKGFREIIEPACYGRFSLVAAKGNVSHRKMAKFYSEVDAFVVSSLHEGEPLTLIEAMASGCFPVCLDVGIVPELIEHGRNGYVVAERTVEAFRRAFEWCEEHAEIVRAAGLGNAEYMARERNWGSCAQFFTRIYRDTLTRADRPLFRNDDVSWDSSLEHFRQFCAVFHKYGQIQIHGVTLRGCTNVVNMFKGSEVEYPGFDSIARLDNALIRQLSYGKAIEDRGDLIEYLNTSPDEVALHGLYHTDYSTMSKQEQERDIAEGLALMRRLFPAKQIRFFIAPFNRTNAATYEVAARHGLTVLAGNGVHLEVELDSLKLRPRQWYRYHHHRFYPESRFDYLNLSIEKLDAALGKNFCSQSRPLGRIDRLTMRSLLSVASRWSASQWLRSSRFWPGHWRLLRSIARTLRDR